MAVWPRGTHDSFSFCGTATLGGTSLLRQMRQSDGVDSAEAVQCHLGPV